MSVSFKSCLQRANFQTKIVDSIFKSLTIYRRFCSIKSLPYRPKEWKKSHLLRAKQTHAPSGRLHWLETGFTANFYNEIPQTVPATSGRMSAKGNSNSEGCNKDGTQPAFSWGTTSTSGLRLCTEPVHIRSYGFSPKIIYNLFLIVAATPH